MSSHSSSPATHSVTLDRGLRALRALLAEPRGMSVAEIAVALGTHRAGVYRLLGPLTDHHLVRRADDGRYVLGPGLIELAGGVEPQLQEAARAILGELAERLNATTALTVRDGDEAVVAAVVTPREQLVHITYRTGMRHSLLLGAPGHALLAAMPARPGEPVQVAAARERGWAVTHGEILRGATGVAAAIPGPGQEPVGAISAVWITGLEPERVARAVTVAAGAIAEAMQG